MWTRELQLVADTNPLAFTLGQPFAQSDGFADSNPHSHTDPHTDHSDFQRGPIVRFHGVRCSNQRRNRPRRQPGRV